MHELELKFVLTEQTEHKLRENPALFRLSGGNPSTSSLRSIYFDTADRALKAAGIALRLRKKGRSWVQTVKAGRSIRAGLSSATEAESRAPGGRLDIERVPDASIRRALKAHLKGAQPEPVCETLIRRTSRELQLEDGSRIELVIDVGEVRARDRAAPLREAELELKSGSPAALFAVARELFAEGDLEFSDLSKAQRGYLLAEEGRISLPVTPRAARKVALSRKMTLEDVAVAILGECLDQIAANVRTVARSDHPEGPHQLRIGLRRLRAAFSIVAPALGREAPARLGDEARWLGHEVGRLRDLDAVLQDIVLPEAGMCPDDKGLAAPIAALKAAGAKERARLRATLRSGRVHGFLFDLAAFIETRGWDGADDLAQAEVLAAPAGKTAAAALTACWRRVAKRARGIAELSTEERHALRKSLKRLRYTAELLAPLYPAKRVNPFLKRLKKLQNLLGDLNDVVVAEAVFSGSCAPAAADPAAQRAVGRIIGVHAERAEQHWASARHEWEALRGGRRFWVRDGRGKPA